MAHISMRLEEAVRDADPVVVTTSSNVRGGRRKIDGETRKLPLSPLPPSPQLVDKEIGRLVLFKARTPSPVLQRNQVASLNSEITYPIYVSCLDGLRNDIFHTSNTNKLV